MYAAVEAAAKADTAAAMTIGDKLERELKVDEIKGALLEKLAGQFEGREGDRRAFRALNKSLVRERVCATRSASTVAWRTSVRCTPRSA